MFTCKGKKCSADFVLTAGLKMQGIHPMQYDGVYNIHGTDWGVDFSHLSKTQLNGFVSTQ